MSNITSIPPNVIRQRIDLILGENGDLGENLSLILLMAAIRCRCHEVRALVVSELESELSFLPPSLIQRLHVLSKGRETTQAIMRNVHRDLLESADYLCVAVEALENMECDD